MDNEWNDNTKLCSIINNCINIEYNIKNINIINDNIKKCKINNNINIEFNLETDNLTKSIKSLGNFFDLSNLDSMILKNKEDIDKFINLLSNKIKIYNMKLLFRASRDRLELNILKEKINNKSNLLFLFLTGNTRIFGTFIKSNIEIKIKNDTYIKDEDAFVFSLNNNKIYRILIPEYAIRFHKDYPILIGNNAAGNGFWIASGKFICLNLL